MNEVIAGYEQAADDLIAAWETLDSAEILALVLEYLPAPPALVLDLGAGPGADAGFLSGKGYCVTAVEPVEAFRVAGARRAGVVWCDGQLPELDGVKGPFDAVLVNGVWQHLPPSARKPAMTRVHELLSNGGRFVLSLRHGPGAADRRIWPIDVDQTIKQADDAGFRLVFCGDRDAHQAENRRRGVYWTWVIFEK